MILLFFFRSVRGEMNHVSCLQKVCCIFLLIVKIHNAHYKSVQLFRTLRLQILHQLKNNDFIYQAKLYCLWIHLPISYDGVGEETEVNYKQNHQFQIKPIILCHSENLEKLWLKQTAVWQEFSVARKGAARKLLAE